MISWNEALKQADPDGITRQEYPTLKRVVYVYKKGNVVAAEHGPLADVKRKYGSGHVYEVAATPESEQALSAHKKAIVDIHRRAHDIWLASLREDYAGLSEKLFQICFEEAYDRGHSSGCDEIANCLEDVVEFAEKILKVER